MKVFKYVTKISVARPNSESGRTTIPKEVMKFLDMKIGDNVVWKVEIENGDINVKIEKI